MKNIKSIGIDLAKNVFQLHAVDAKRKCVLRKRLTRERLIEFIANIPPCEIGIESCGGSHYWAREFRACGHTVKMMPPQFVKPYVMANKNDQNDARGIAEAMNRPEMKYVPIKNIEQQDILMLHRVRELAVKQRTAHANQIRGLLLEYGVTIAKGINQIRNLLEIIEDNKERLTTLSIRKFRELYEEYKQIEERVEKCDKEIELIAKKDIRCQEIMKIKGVGPLTASAVVATIGDGKAFKKGREVSAWLGLVPKQNSSGNKIRLGGISKRGDKYIRMLLIHGARSVIRTCEGKMDARNLWVLDKRKRCGYNKAAVALANKNARVIWAILSTGECYREAPIIEERMCA